MWKSVVYVIAFPKRRNFWYISLATSPDAPTPYAKIREAWLISFTSLEIVFSSIPLLVMSITDLNLVAILSFIDETFSPISISSYSADSLGNWSAASSSFNSLNPSTPISWQNRTIVAVLIPVSLDNFWIEDFITVLVLLLIYSAKNCSFFGIWAFLEWMIFKISAIFTPSWYEAR